MVVTLMLADELHASTDPNTMLAYVEMVFGNIAKDKVYNQECIVIVGITNEKTLLVGDDSQSAGLHKSSKLS